MTTAVLAKLPSEAILATVTIRREKGWSVRETAAQLEGKRHKFTRGWLIKEGSIYDGETAWLPVREGWPEDAPIWIASGDLTDITEQT